MLEMERLINDKEVAGMLGIGLSTLQRWKAKRVIPFIKIGKTVKYSPSEIMAWLENQKVAVNHV